jgi:hypothetical protein
VSSKKAHSTMRRWLKKLRSKRTTQTPPPLSKPAVSPPGADCTIDASPDWISFDKDPAKVNDPGIGVLTLTIDLSRRAGVFPTDRKKLCQPTTCCSVSGDDCTCKALGGQQPPRRLDDVHCKRLSRARVVLFIDSSNPESAYICKSAFEAPVLQSKPGTEFNVAEKDVDVDYSKNSPVGTPWNSGTTPRVLAGDFPGRGAESARPTLS